MKLLVIFAKKEHPPLTDSALLEQLFAGKEPAERAWKEFLHRYSNLFLKIIWQFERDRDTVMERYVYVCSKLAANNFAVLRKFNPQGQKHSPKLSTWLTIVVRHLCVESYRRERGRQRFPRALLKMSPLERRIFRLYYWEGFTIREIQQMLSTSKDHSPNRIDAALRRVKAFIFGNPRGSDQKPVIIAYDEMKHDTPVPHNDSDFDGMEHLFEMLSELLTARERAVIRLRFWEDLSAREIGEVLHISPVRKVYTHLEQALKKLRQRTLKEFQE